MKKIDYFFCYNNVLLSELLAKGFVYITRARHFKTNELFTLFAVTDELSEFLATRKSNKTK